ncbi:MAG TPA: hypothetical protein VGK74_25460 [Symbiobacteriaceae bacterium]
MDNYLGIIVEQCLRDPALTAELHIAAVKRGEYWTFLLASVPEADFAQHIRLLQSHMVLDDHWYAHYFRGNELVVVYGDAVFRMSTDKESWGPAVAHGLASGIPLEQLDFHPNTRQDIEQFFGKAHT